MRNCGFIWFGMDNYGITSGQSFKISPLWFILASGFIRPLLMVVEEDLGKSASRIRPAVIGSKLLQTIY